MEVLNAGDNLLVIQTAFIGDCLLTLPMIAVLAEKNPGIIIDVVTTGKSYDIFSAYENVRKVYLFDKRGKHKSLKSLINFAGELKSENYKRVIAPHRSARTSILVLLSGIKDSYGFDNSALKFVYRNNFEYKFNAHEVYRNLVFAGDEAAQVDPWKIEYNLKISAGERNEINTVLESLRGKKIIAVAPGTEWATKQYPEEHFTSVCSGFISNGFAIAIIGTEKESGLAGRIAAGCGSGAVDLCGRFSIPGTINFLKQCELLLTNDSSPVHMGYIAKVKTLSLYCSTVPEFGFYPLGERSGWLSKNDLNCKPCGIHGYKACPLDHFRCGRDLLPGTVINKMEQLLSND